MNNDQFRKLALGAAGAPAGTKNETPKAGGSLGSRQKASIPMTPRSGSSVSRVAFARQMAERFQDAEQQKSGKTRLSVPRGSRLGPGYVDRAKLRAELASGDAPVPAKGLDFQLLERARKGEAVLDETLGTAKAVEDSVPKTAQVAVATVIELEAPDEGDGGASDAVDVDDEFERLEETEVHAVAREKTKKRGQLATTGSLTAAPGQKRTRDQILAELKAAREVAAAAKKKEEESALGSRFKKIGPATAASASAGTRPSSRIEIDSRGREVLVLVDEDGREKRKVRKLAAGADTAASRRPPEDGGRDNDAPTTKEVLGMEVPEFYRKKLEAEAAAAAAKEMTIFDDAGSDYDPLAGLESDDSDSDTGETAKETERKTEMMHKDDSGREEGEVLEGEAKTAPTTPTAPAAIPGPARNYFKDAKLLSEMTTTTAARPSLDDPHVLAVLRKAKQLRQATETEARSKETEREQRLKKLLQNSDRDAEDLDMGFGTNRLEDEEDLDEDGERVRLSVWGSGGGGGGEDGEDGAGGQGGRAKRKRGPKKRKGDGNNADDVLRVLEKRREG